jgi:hypothetical protein
VSSASRSETRHRSVFVTHSIPDQRWQRPPVLTARAYVDQHIAVARLVADAVRAETGVDRPWALVYCSRSGPPQVPWLEPDVNAHLEQLAGAGVTGVVAVPIGFVSDHMEVVLRSRHRGARDRRPPRPGVRPGGHSRSPSELRRPRPRPARRTVRRGAGRTGSPSGGRRGAGGLGRLRGDLLPQPAYRARGVVRASRRARVGAGVKPSAPTADTDARPARPRGHDGTGRGRAHRRGPARSGPGRRDQVEPDGRGHRQRRGLGTADPFAHPVGAPRPTASSVRRVSPIEGTSGVRWVADPIDGTGQLPVRDPSVRRVDCGRERRAERRRGRPRRDVGRAVHRCPRRWRPKGRRADLSVLHHGAQPALVGTGYHYRSDVRVHQAAELARLLPRIRDVRRWARPRSTSATSPAGVWTPTSNADCGPGTWRRTVGRRGGGRCRRGSGARRAHRAADDGRSAWAGGRRSGRSSSPAAFVDWPMPQWPPPR